MELDYYCSQCGKYEKYPRKKNTTFICSSCACNKVMKCRDMFEHFEKQRIQPAKRKGIRITKKKQTLATADFRK